MGKGVPFATLFGALSGEVVFGGESLGYSGPALLAFFLEQLPEHRVLFLAPNLLLLSYHKQLL
jgi:hypothetical protein